jgi:predicted glutamine amidotransferase
MCRWAAYRGTPIPLEQIVSAPGHSLIEQSQQATQAKTATNGDGFGVAWYGEHPEPGLYRDVLPAWSDCNLKSLARQIRSPLFLAHVRASTGGATSRDNCHPFVNGRWSFMHNGQIAGFEKIRRPMETALSDRLYQARHGTTDSELLFLLAIEFGLETDPGGGLRRSHPLCAFGSGPRRRARAGAVHRGVFRRRDAACDPLFQRRLRANALFRADLQQPGPLPGVRTISRHGHEMARDPGRELCDPDSGRDIVGTVCADAGGGGGDCRGGLRGWGNSFEPYSDFHAVFTVALPARSGLWCVLHRSSGSFG